MTENSEAEDNLKRLRALERSLLDPQTVIENPELAIKLFELSPDAIVIVDRQGIIRMMNQQAELMFGYHRAELTDQSVEILIPEGLRRQHKEHRAKYVEEPRTRPMGIGLYVTALRKDGSTFVIEANLSPLVTKSGWFVIATVRRKRSGGR